MFGLGTLTVQARLIERIPPGVYNKTVTFKGVITYYPDRTDDWYSMEARGVLYVNKHPVVSNARVILYTKYNVKAYNDQYGEVVVATGELRLPSGQRNPSGFNYRAYLLTQGIFG